MIENVCYILLGFCTGYLIRSILSLKRSYKMIKIIDEVRADVRKMRREMELTYESVTTEQKRLESLFLLAGDKQ